MGFGVGCLGCCAGVGGGWGSLSGPSLPLALAPALARRAGEGVCWWSMEVLVGGFVWGSFFLRRCASLPSRWLGRSRTAPTGRRSWCSRAGAVGGVVVSWKSCLDGGVLLASLPGHPPLAFGFAPPCVFDEGGCGPAFIGGPLCPSDISPASGGNLGVLQRSSAGEGKVVGVR